MIGDTGLRTTVVLIRILIRTTVVPIRGVIGTSVVRIRILIGMTVVRIASAIIILADLKAFSLHGEEVIWLANFGAWIGLRGVVRGYTLNTDIIYFIVRSM